MALKWLSTGKMHGQLVISHGTCIYISKAVGMPLNTSCQGMCCCEQKCGIMVSFRVSGATEGNNVGFVTLVHIAQVPISMDVTLCLALLHKFTLFFEFLYVGGDFFIFYLESGYMMKYLNPANSHPMPYI